MIETMLNVCYSKYRCLLFERYKIVRFQGRVGVFTSTINYAASSHKYAMRCVLCRWLVMSSYNLQPIGVVRSIRKSCEPA